MPADRRIHFRTAPPTLREREGGGMPTLVGHAAVFDAETTIWDGRRVRLREVVRRGAFARAVREGQDVIANQDHEDSWMLGRTASGTLRLREDDVGLAVEIDLPDTALGRDVAELVRRRDLAGMSFAFIPAKAGGERQTITQLPDGRDDVFTELLDVDLFDVAVEQVDVEEFGEHVDRAAPFEAEHRRKARELWLEGRRSKLEALKARAQTSR